MRGKLVTKHSTKQSSSAAVFFARLVGGSIDSENLEWSFCILEIELLELSLKTPNKSEDG